MKRRRTISSNYDETMDEITPEQSPSNISARKRKRLDPVNFCMIFFRRSQNKSQFLIYFILMIAAGNVSTIVRYIACA